MKFFSIIPARGGSKGVPGKNIKMLNGKPLICHTIEAALKSKYLYDVYVSTEDAEIAKISINCGAHVIMRPAELATDESPRMDAIFHAIDEKKKERSPDIVILLQATSPLRNTEDIDAAIQLFFKNEDKSVISMCKVEHPPQWCFRFYKNGHFKPLFGDNYFRMRRQDLPDMFRPNGAIYISSLSNLNKNKEFYCDNIVPYIMPVERSIDIDTETDFLIAGQLLHRRILQ